MDPTLPLDQGWRTMKSTISAPSFTSPSRYHGQGRSPKEAPDPRTSTSTQAYPRDVNRSRIGAFMGSSVASVRNGRAAG